MASDQDGRDTAVVATPSARRLTTSWLGVAAVVQCTCLPAEESYLEGRQCVYERDQHDVQGHGER